MYRRLSPWLPLVGIPALLPDDPTGPNATSAGGAQPTPDPVPQPSPDLGDSGKRALAAERAAVRAAEKRATDAEARLKKLDEEKLSDQEKATKRAEDAEERATAAEAKALRLEVATEKGLPAALVGRLVGSTKEELSADADALKELLGQGSNGTNGDGQAGTQPPPQGASRVPRPDHSQGGGRPADTGTVRSGADLYAQRKQQSTTASVIT